MGAAYRIASNSVQRSTDGGLHWQTILTPRGHRQLPGGAGCAPAHYVAVNAILQDRQLRDTLYVATSGTPGDYHNAGCDAAVGGFYVLANAGAPIARDSGLPFNQDPAGRTIRAYDLGRLTLDPTDGTKLIVDARGGFGPASPPAGLYCTIDGGRTWRFLHPLAAPTTTRTPTRSPTPTATCTATPTPTATPSATSTVTPTVTSTFSPTATGTASPTPMSTAVPVLGYLPASWAWTPITSNGAAGSPPPRQDATVVWDPTDRELLVFGGTDTGGSAPKSDLWAYSPASGHWSQLASCPSGRFGTTGAWDSVGNRLLIFGGQTGSGAIATFTNDVLAYSPSSNTWATLSARGAAGAPAPRSRAAGAWDASTSRMIIFGGETIDSPLAVAADLWAFTPSNGAWTLLDAGGGLEQPPARSWASLAWDPIASVIRLFGGKNAASSTYSDTWEWNGAWHFDEARAQPSGRGAAAAVWDVQHAHFLIGPGLGLNGDANDTSAYEPGLNSWLALNVSNSNILPPRQMTGMAWDDADGQAFLFGGRMAGVGAANDLWMLAATTNAPMPTATPTSTALPGPSPLPTGTSTAPPNPTATVTLTPTATISPTITATATVTGTVTATATLSHTVTATATFTGTSTATGTPTATITPTVTITPTATLSGTVTATATISRTVTATTTITPTLSPTVTLTPTIIASPTPTLSPTVTPSPSATSTSVPPAVPPIFVPGAVRKALDIGLAVDPTGKVLVTDQEVAAVAATGATLVRIDFVLGQAVSWTPTLLGTYAAVVAKFENAGISVIGLVSAGATTDNNQADWTANAHETVGGNGDNAFIQSAYVPALEQLVTYFHDPSKSNIPYPIVLWELWNEPNVYSGCNGTVCTGLSYIYPSNFAALLAESYEKIKFADGIADVMLISGGLFGHSILGVYSPANSGAAYLTSTYQMGIRVGTWNSLKAQTGSYPLDAIGQHIYVDQAQYSTPATVQAYMDWLRGAYTAFEGANTAKQTIVTEAGWSTTSVSQVQQADNVDALYWAAKTVPYVPAATWFQVQDNPGANLHFGLYDSIFTTKPALSRYQSQ